MADQPCPWVRKTSETATGPAGYTQDLKGTADAHTGWHLGLEVLEMPCVLLAAQKPKPSALHLGRRRQRESRGNGSRGLAMDDYPLPTP